MGNGQLIHLEIDSGCGVPHKPGQALGNWSRARSRPETGQAAKEVEYAGFRCVGSAPCGAWGSRGLVCLVLKHATKTWSYTDHFSFTNLVTG